MDAAGDLGLAGAKFGRGMSLCGACSVVVNKEAVRSCVTPMKEVDGKQVLIIEGSGEKQLPAVQQAAP